MRQLKHSVKKVSGIDHLKSPLKGIVKILFVQVGTTVLYTGAEFECHLSFRLFTVIIFPVF